MVPADLPRGVHRLHRSAWAQGCRRLGGVLAGGAGFLLLLEGYPLAMLLALLAGVLAVLEQFQGEGPLLAYARDARGLRLRTRRRGWVPVSAIRLGGYAPVGFVVRWREAPQGPWRRALLWRDSFPDAPYRALARVHRRLRGTPTPFF